MIKQQRVDLAARPTAGGGEGAPRSAALASPSDHLNRAIIGLLQEDGRLPFKTIAERLDVSEGTVRNRVGWMKRAGMLRIVAVADPAEAVTPHAAKRPSQPTDSSQDQTA